MRVLESFHHGFLRFKQFQESTCWVVMMFLHPFVEGKRVWCYSSELELCLVEISQVIRHFSCICP